ncbi:MAG TPA: helicase C-terminal domain-containing protein, partial [Candidatus Thermoplasmatota archaeon]|nr:helicase C-terminal domain-containing protein [Candidatus Thermoplasmatota archaeon]
GAAILAGVLGGRLSEGLDFPGEAMENLLVFAVPYPRPSARSQALIHHYDRVAGSGWQVAVHHPVSRTLRQAIGRLIRGPADRGVAVILDERAVRFRGQIPRLRLAATVAEVLAGPGPEPEGYWTAEQWPRKVLPKGVET